MKNKGRLIVLEGLDGSGKSTQIELLFQRLLNKGMNIKKISFPDYSDKSSELVKMYLNGEFSSDPTEVNAYAASTFYAADRYASYMRYWKHDFQTGTDILAARYTTSNCIYQMTKLPKCEWNDYLDWLEDYEYGKLGLPKPDSVIFLDMPIEISQQLMTRRYNGDESQKDIHESNIDYLQQCREAALFTAERQKWSIIPCSKGGDPIPPDQINDDLYSLFEFI